MRILGLESTCDETAAAVVENGRRVLSNVIATQIDLHAKYRGVVPEIASRAHIENILPVIHESLATAACGLAQIDAIAVAHRPGLIGSLLITVTAAKTLAWMLNKPLIGVDHVHAHLFSVLLDNDVEVELPAVGLVVSGGHTSLYKINSWTCISLIGSTIDDAVGEAYDKVAAVLNLEYPGGPILDKLASHGNPRAVELPRAMMGKGSLDFSFSGLKTAVLYHVRGVPGRNDPPREMNDAVVRDIAASFQAACIDTIEKKLKRAVRAIDAKSIVIGGGVSANRGLRATMKKFGLPAYFPATQFCTDNAAMSAGLAHVLLNSGKKSGLDLDAITYSELRA